MQSHLIKAGAVAVSLTLSGCAALETTGEVVGGIAQAVGETTLFVADVATFGAISSLTGFKDAGWAASPETSASLYSTAATAYMAAQSTAPSNPSSAPGATRATGSGAEFQPQLLQDFRVKSSDGLVEVCVWDHECEDGDILGVSINGKQYQAELTSAKSCRRVHLHEGANTIRIVAVNGTGYKGSCSFENVNTGTISVTSLTSLDRSSQTYKVRGGQGSSASIIVYP